MFNIKKATFAELRAKYLKALKVNDTERYFEKFAALADDIHQELERRQRSAIYQYCVRSGCLKMPEGWTNYFQYCAHFADKCMEDNGRFCDDESYEIRGYYCKYNHPNVVWFD